MLTAPAGMSLVATASASSTAARGCALGGDDDGRVAADERRQRGATRGPRARGSGGARIATTPVGSGIVKLKYGPATGFAPPSTWASLSAQPAYQTTRSIERSTSSPARSRPRPGRRRASPSSRPAGRAPGRGCRRSRPTTSRRPRGPRARRRGRPCARRGRRSGPRPRRCGPTRSAGTRRRCRACRSCAPGRRVTRRTSGTPRAHGGRPRARSPTPCSRRTARPGRSG